MPMKLGAEMPKFEGTTDWLTGSQLEAENFATNGKPTLVHFWAISCGICKENMPKIAELRDSNAEKLNVVAVHMPRYEADSNLDDVKAAIEKYGVKEICAVDNLHKLKDAFLNEQGWVPVYYLFDAEGKLKTRAAGEFGYGIISAALEKILAPQISNANA